MIVVSIEVGGMTCESCAESIRLLHGGTGTVRADRFLVATVGLRARRSG